MSKRQKIDGFLRPAPESGTTEDVLLSVGDFVEYRPSLSWPVVLSVPHGGTLLPDSISDRTEGCIEPDWESCELAEEIAKAFSTERQGPPALVRLRLHRLKLEANRARRSCSECCTEEAVQAWDAYHGWLEEAIHGCTERFGFCLLLDIHGQSHRQGVTELGYLLTSEDLLLSNEAEAAAPRPTSIDALLPLSSLCKSAAGKLDWRSLVELVRGPGSLGGLLEASGFRCTPSPSYPQPVTAEALASARLLRADLCGTSGPPKDVVQGATYFWGAYTVRKYGCARSVPPECNPLPVEAQEGWANNVAAVQLETSWIGVREDAPSRIRFGEALRKAVECILKSWKGWSPQSRS